MWTVAQQFAVRGAVALKFFLAARILGPEEIGAFGVALLALAIAEGLTDTGLLQAVVHSRKAPRSIQLGSLWTLQLSRGVLISGALCVMASPAAQLFRVPGAASLLLLVALVPAIKGLANPGILLLQRNREFKRSFVYESIGAWADFVLSVFLIQGLGFAAAGMVLGTIFGESLKCTLSWSFFRSELRPNFRWRLIGNLTSFGKWIWGSSFVTLMINQFDKVLVAKLLGPSAFGLYSVATRISQLAIAEPGFAIGHYLFPTLADAHRVSGSSVRARYLSFVRWIGLALLIVATLLFLLSEFLLVTVLGPAWLPAAGVLKISCVTMLFAALIASMVAYFRAVGRPQVITKAVLVQLLVVCAAALVLIPGYGAVGAAAASAIAHAVTFALLGALLIARQREEGS